MKPGEKVDFNRIWVRIRSHAGEEFRQIRGRTFTYAAYDGYIVPSRSN